MSGARRSDSRSHAWTTSSSRRDHAQVPPPARAHRLHRAGRRLLDLGQRDDPLLALAHEGEAQVAVLQQHPDALRDALLEQLARGRLLALAHTDAEHRLLALAREVVDLARRVRAGGQDGRSCQEVGGADGRKGAGARAARVFRSCTRSS